MEIRTEDYEHLGKFYLGREYDLATKSTEDSLLLYDSKDLVTHGVVLGMTGSGKTGLCMALLEEAAMDNIPSIVIDPKGDISNLLLTFPDLTPEEFRPWINEEDAAKKGITPDEHAAKTAEMWKNGLESWGQSGERIRQFRDKVDIAVYTPGSNAGLPVSILSSLDVPEFEVLDDAEALGERIESTVSSILSLVGIDADPLQSSDHILMSNIFSHCWRSGHSVTLETLIRHLQVPPFDKIGVMDIETVCPEKGRRELALKLNNLLASPGFATWMQGEPLNIRRMLHTTEGKPRISIFSISHLGDAERMFFVSLLLNQTLGWMRSQPGTTSLRALLYMDEIFGYLPPTASPPSKKPMMTMLKQARAFGLGVLLATQNPVDLDYKALSNIGTWWLGRLQTERDKARVLDGLQGAAADANGKFDRAQMEQLLSGLGARVFLMNNVHDDAPTVFHVRWVMSYLVGPMARGQIKQLMDPKREAVAAAPKARTMPPPLPAAYTSAHPAATHAAAPAAAAPLSAPASQRPRLPRGAEDFYLPVISEFEVARINYEPAVIRVGEVRYQDARRGINADTTVVFVNRIAPSSGEVDWTDSLELPNGLTYSQLSRQPAPTAHFAPVPQALLDSKLWTGLQKELVDHLYSRHSVDIYRSPATGLFSNVDETEGEFRARLLHASHEVRDKKVEELKATYRKKIQTIEDRLARAEDTVADQKAQANSVNLDTAMRVGGTILGAVLGRRVGTQTRTTINTASRAMRKSRDVARAKDRVESFQSELDDLEAELEQEIANLKDSLDPMREALETVTLTPLKKNCAAKAVGIVWKPVVVPANPQPTTGW